MAYILYGGNGSGSAACEALLALLDVDYTVIDVEKDENGKRPESYLAINPLGQVPTLLLENGLILTESAAIMTYLADSYPECGLTFGLDDPLRADYLRWMFYFSANIYPTVLRYYYSDRYTTDPEGGPQVKEAATERLMTEWAVFEAALGEGPFLFGDKVSAVDVYATMFASWSDDPRAFLDSHPNVARMVRGVGALPLLGPIWEKHEILTT